MSHYDDIFLAKPEEREPSDAEWADAEAHVRGSLKFGDLLQDHFGEHIATEEEIDDFLHDQAWYLVVEKVYGDV
jgi:hypothetical protein